MQMKEMLTQALMMLAVTKPKENLSAEKSDGGICGLLWFA